MAKLEYTLTEEQYKALSGLAYWIADDFYIRERHGIDDPERQRAVDTITKCCFPECDRLNIPFWVQNTVICWAEQWRNYESGYLWQFLKTRNINRG